MKTKVKKKYTEKAIERRIARLAKTIRKDLGDDREVFLLGILKGTTCFLSDLMRAIPGEVSYGFINVERNVADTDVAAALEITFVTTISLSGKNVYLLKDVMATGVIENYLLTQLRQKNPASLKLVALLDHPKRRRVDIQPDYRAFEVDEGTYVGYGLDGTFTNLPYIGRV